MLQLDSSSGHVPGHVQVGRKVGHGILKDGDRPTEHVDEDLDVQEQFGIVRSPPSGMTSKDGEREAVERLLERAGLRASRTRPVPAPHPKHRHWSLPSPGASLTLREPVFSGWQGQTA